MPSFFFRCPCQNTKVSIPENASAVIGEGTVVIVSSGQAGTVVYCDQHNITVLLRNLCLWQGKRSQVYVPQSQEEVDAAPLEVDRFEERERASKKQRTKRTKSDEDDYFG